MPPAREERSLVQPAPPRLDSRSRCGRPRRTAGSGYPAHGSSRSPSAREPSRARPPARRGRRARGRHSASAPSPVRRRRRRPPRARRRNAGNGHRQPLATWRQTSSPWWKSAGPRCGHRGSRFEASARRRCRAIVEHLERRTEARAGEGPKGRKAIAPTARPRSRPTREAVAPAGNPRWHAAT